MPQYPSGHRFTIVNGPGAKELEDAMFYRYPDKPRHMVTMTLFSIGTVTIHLNGIAEESCGTDDWLFFGWITESSLANMRVSGYYDTKRRRGVLKFQSDEDRYFDH